MPDISNHVQPHINFSETSLGFRGEETKEIPIYDFSVLERNKLNKFINVNKTTNNMTKNYSETNNSTMDIRFSYPEKEREREIELDNLNFNNQSFISAITKYSNISRPNSRDYETPNKNQNGNIFTKENFNYDNNNLKILKNGIMINNGIESNVKMIYNDGNLFLNMRYLIHLLIK
jgi:hypothetical protein